jgi:hypothetical protein
MITLYQGSGASGFEVHKPAISDDEWSSIRDTAISLLSARNGKRAAGLLRCYPFFPHHGTNDFNDEFLVLWLPLPVVEYVKVAAWKRNPQDKETFKLIAGTLNEMNLPIRFIAADVVHNAPRFSVKAPTLEITSNTVELALQDVETLVRAGAVVSGVDRIHTALHGYLIRVCEDASLAEGLGLRQTTSQLFKRLRSHPAFAEAIPQQDEAERLLNGLATALDALNPLRNHGSAAHPNEFLLDEPEALLAINSARTILHYIDLRIKTYKLKAKSKARPNSK